MRAKGKGKKKKNPCHGWYLSPLEDHLCVPYDRLPPCLARRQMGYLAAVFLVCLEAEPSSSHHGVNAGTGRVLSPTMTPPWQLPINHFPRGAAPRLLNSVHVDNTNFNSFNPGVLRSANALALPLPSEADETPYGGEFFRSSGVHLVKREKKEFWKEEPEVAGLLVAKCPVRCSFIVLFY